MALYEEDMIDDLADEAEGPAQAYDEGFDEWDEADEVDEVDEVDELDEVDEIDEGDEWDEGDDVDDIDALEDTDVWDEGDEVDDDALEEAMAYALAAEDTDEFFRRIGGLLRRAARGAGRVARGAVSAARRAAPVIGQIARTAAPLLRVIPHPLAQGAATAANLLGQLRMEGADEDEALEAMAELAARNPRVLPVVGGLAARALVRRAGPALPPAARRAAVRTATQAARTLVRRQGPAAVRALPRVVRSVRRTAATRRTPPAMRPRVALNTARRVAASPQLARRLARPLPRGRAIVRQAVATGRVPARAGGGMMRAPMGGMMRRRRYADGGAGAASSSVVRSASPGWAPERGIASRSPGEVHGRRGDERVPGGEAHRSHGARATPLAPLARAASACVHRTCRSLRRRTIFAPPTSAWRRSRFASTGAWPISDASGRSPTSNGSWSRRRCSSARSIARAAASACSSKSSASAARRLPDRWPPTTRSRPTVTVRSARRRRRSFPVRCSSR